MTYMYNYVVNRMKKNNVQWTNEILYLLYFLPYIHVSTVPPRSQLVLVSGGSMAIFMTCKDKYHSSSLDDGIMFKY